jgi:hypothetical protein
MKAFTDVLTQVMKSVFISILIIFIFSTEIQGQFRDVKYVGFPKSITPELIEVKIPPVLLWELAVTANKDYLLSYNPNNDTIFRVFGLPDLKYIGAFGVKGRGPREFLGSSPASLKALNDGFQIEKDGSLEVIGFPEGVKINNNNFQVLKIFNLPAELSNCNYAIILNDSMVCCSSNMGATKQLTCVNTKTKEVSYLIDFPSFYHRTAHSSYYHFYTASKAISLDRERIAIAYSRLPLISIYDKNGVLVKSTFLDEAPKQKSNIEFIENQVRNSGQLYSYYGGISVTSKYIFASFQITDYEGPGLQNKRIHTNRQIHVFDWDGNPVGKVNLKKNMTWTASFDNSCLYLIDPDVENKIFKASLSELFK